MSIWLWWISVAMCLPPYPWVCVCVSLCGCWKITQTNKCVIWAGEGAHADGWLDFLFFFFSFFSLWYLICFVFLFFVVNVIGFWIMGVCVCVCVAGIFSIEFFIIWLRVCKCKYFRVYMLVWLWGVNLRSATLSVVWVCVWCVCGVCSCVFSSYRWRVILVCVCCVSVLVMGGGGGGGACVQ